MQTIKREFRSGGSGGRASLARLAACAAMLASLSACGSLGLGWGSGGSDPDAKPSAAGSIMQNIAMGGPVPAVQAKPAPVQTRFPSAVDQDVIDFDCPVLEVAPNGAATRDYGGSSEGGAQALRHQISISNLARECKDAGANIAMKLGVEGSVLLGPAGAPGTFTVPLVFEARIKDKVVTTRRENLSVTIPPNETRAFFSTVLADFSIPKADDTDLYVGLSPSGGQALRPPVHRKRRPKS
ncbi:hypothetical protein SAMN05444161_2436 [Rhizobiales bacterium GAS191]|jgi:hypothetical protein|nr:hypothetical protein SAMN05519103_01549 [Rhizobiales bacterium GAS113]SEC16605.1 hypothetical protein SAMN05519104_0878 [Rhizobiales bacterium GAS188]SED06684.1 hypothetical protein SAMN05444161_2436 [Rhizobiales bacterium GAS191]